MERVMATIENRTKTFVGDDREEAERLAMEWVDEQGATSAKIESIPLVFPDTTKRVEVWTHTPGKMTTWRFVSLEEAARHLDAMGIKPSQIMRTMEIV